MKININDNTIFTGDVNIAVFTHCKENNPAVYIPALSGNSALIRLYIVVNETHSTPTNNRTPISMIAGESNPIPNPITIPAIKDNSTVNIFLKKKLVPLIVP